METVRMGSGPYWIKYDLQGKSYVERYLLESDRNRRMRHLSKNRQFLTKVVNLLKGKD